MAEDYSSIKLMVRCVAVLRCIVAFSRLRHSDGRPCWQYVYDGRLFYSLEKKCIPTYIMYNTRRNNGMNKRTDCTKYGTLWIVCKVRLTIYGQNDRVFEEKKNELNARILAGERWGRATCLYEANVLCRPCETKKKNS